MCLAGEDIGRNTIVIPRGALKDDTLISMSMKHSNKRIIFNLDREPGGKFHKLVRVRLSWQALKDVPFGDLDFVYNGDEPVRLKFYPKRKIVIFYTKHFSEYYFYRR